MSETTRTCQFCRFWKPEADSRDRVNKYEAFDCRAEPPKLAAQLGYVGIWPMTQGREWCGKWAAFPKPAKTP